MNYLPPSSSFGVASKKSNSQVPTPENNRKCTLPTPEAKGPTHNAALAFGVVILGVVSYGVQSIGSEHHNGKCSLQNKSLMFWVQLGLV